MKRSHWVVVIVATAALVVMAPEEESAGGNGLYEPGELVREAEMPGGQAWLKSNRVELERLARLEKQRRERIKASDVFNSTSWYVPPPAPKVVAPPPAPRVVVVTAPPLPFTYLGRYGEGDARVVILARGDRMYTVGVGEVIDNQYRVDRISGGVVGLTYLPMNVQQSLQTGEAL
jgi:hypothetical protein